MTDIHFLSHSGTRAHESFEMTRTAISADSVKPLIEINIPDRYGDDRTERIFEIDGSFYFGGTFEQYLGDVEVDGTTVLFDGRVPHHDTGGCHLAEVLVTEDSIFVWASMDRPLAVLRDGRNHLEFQSLGNLNWAVRREPGRMLPDPVQLVVESLADDAEGVTVHDPAVTDLIGFAQESAEFSRQRLREISTRMWEVADRIRRRAEGEGHESVRHLHVPMSDLTRHSENLTIAEALLDA